MSVTCPKCGHKLEPSGSVPIGECPSCGLILSKRSLAAQDQRRKSDEASKSWFRGEPVEEPARDVDSAAEAKPLAASASNSKTATCPACGGLVAKGAKACPHCGKQNPAPKPTNRAVLLLAGLLLVGFMVMLSTREPGTSSSSHRATGQRTPGVQYIDTGRAVTLCENYARSKAAHPSTVDFSRVFDLSIVEHPNGRTTVRSSFTAKNSFNLELKHDIRCLFDHTGLIEASIYEARR